MDEEITMSIPLDEDGCLLLQCPRCGELFKVLGEDYEAEDVWELWCPMCGIKSDCFLPEDALELAKAKVLNHVMETFGKELANIGKGLPRQSPIRLTVTSHFEKARERELFPAVDAYVSTTCGFCGRSERIKPLLKYIGAFCTFCGERL
jgi:hypothetical protein